MSSNSKGDRGERELVNVLVEAGWWPMRAPASGSATENDLPDVMAGKDRVMIAVEAKRWAGGLDYIDGEKVKALYRFARAYGAVPLAGFRYDRDTNWYFQNPARMPTTDGGNIRVRQEDVVEYPTLEELDQLVERHQSSD